MTPQIGDWIRYRCFRLNAVVIDVVLYVTEQDRYPMKPEVITLHDRVTFDEILEIRRVSEGLP